MILLGLNATKVFEQDLSGSTCVFFLLCPELYSWSITTLKGLNHMSLLPLLVLFFVNVSKVNKNILINKVYLIVKILG